MIYLTEGEFDYFKKLKESFCKRTAKYFQKPQIGKKEGSGKFVECRSLTNEEDVNPTEGFIYQKEAICWKWQRVKEYYREMTSEERYEKLLKEIKI